MYNREQISSGMTHLSTSTDGQGSAYTNTPLTSRAENLIGGGEGDDIVNIGLQTANAIEPV